MTRKQVDFNTCVWGDWHLDVMRRVMLPTLLSPGNLPAISGRFPTRYRIATTPSDRRRIESWPIFSALAATIEIEWITEASSPDITYHIEWYRRSLQDAKAANAYCFTVYPDVAWSDGVLARCADAIAHGKIGVSIPYIRVISETILPELAGRAGDNAIKLTGGDLVRLGMRHMHPLSVAAMASGCDALPSLDVIWRVPGQGILLRHISRELSMVDTERLQANQYWNAIDAAGPGSLHVAADSDDMMMLSVAPLLKDFHVYIPNHAVQPIDLARVSLHPANDNPLMQQFATHQIRLHYDGMDESRWREVERRADDFIGEALFTREYLRIWGAAQANGCSLAAQAMSIALLTTSLAKHSRYGGPVTAYVAADSAFKDCGWESVAPLLRPDAGCDLEGLIRNHTADGVIATPVAGSWRQETLGGTTLQGRTDSEGEFVNGVRILRRIDVPPHQICIIDRWLSTVAPATSAVMPAVQHARSPEQEHRPSDNREVRPAVRTVEQSLLFAMPSSDDDIALNYQSFIQNFALDLDEINLDRQKRAAAAALYQAGVYRHKLLMLHDLMQRFSAQADATDPLPAFFAYCTSLVGDEALLAQTSRYYTLAVQLLPDFAEALYALALLKRRESLTAEAIALFQAAIEARPHPNAQAHAHIAANAWRNLAELHRDQGRADLAEACFRSALECLGIHGVYHAEFAEFLRSRGRYAEAVMHYERMMPYSHLYASQFTEPDYPPEERLPLCVDGKPCDVLRPAVIGATADGQQQVYWWHLRFTLPPGAPFDAASILRTRPQARLIV